MARKKKEQPNLTALAPPFKVQIQIESNVEPSMIYESDGESFAGGPHLSFMIRHNGSEPDIIQAVPLPDNSQQQRAKDYWLFRFLYVKQHMEQAFNSTIEQLWKESEIVGRGVDIDGDQQLAMALDALLQTEGKPKRIISPVGYFLSRRMQEMRTRLKGGACFGPEEKREPFTFVEFSIYHQRYPKHLALWQKARRIQKSLRGQEWREQVKAECGKLDDDLLDCLGECALNGRRTYEWDANHIAVIDTARLAGIENAKISQWRDLRRAFDKGKQMLELAARLGLKL